MSTALLLDTNAFIRWMGDALTGVAADVVADPRAIVWVSAASLYEMTYKSNRGRLEIPADPRSDLVAAGFAPLSITDAHAERAGALPLHHRDPFDRLLIAQAQIEGLAVVTSDRAFERYEVDLVWC